jgi:hypothetical protein
MTFERGGKSLQFLLIACTRSFGRRWSRILSFIKRRRSIWIYELCVYIYIYIYQIIIKKWIKLNTIDSDKIKLWILLTYLKEIIYVPLTGHHQRMHAQKLVPCACLKHFTRIEFNQIIVKYDNGVKLELKSCAHLVLLTCLREKRSSRFHSPTTTLTNCFEILLGKENK